MKVSGLWYRHCALTVDRCFVVVCFTVVEDLKIGFVDVLLLSTLLELVRRSKKCYVET